MIVTRIQDIISELSERYNSLANQEQYWIGLAGGPGSGKSTICEQLLSALGQKLTVIPMDGYHFYRSQLDAMENSTQAHRRRGAPFTFDADRLVRDLQQARESGSGNFPSFDHKQGDPVEAAIHLEPKRQIVLIEGNYLLLDHAPWSELKQGVFDETWFLDVDLAECRRRVTQRHIETGLRRS